MRDARIAVLAENLLGYSVAIQPGEKLLIEARGTYSLELVKELIRLATTKGAIPFWHYNDETLERQFARSASVDQMRTSTELQLRQMKEMDAYIAIRGSENAFEMADISAEQSAAWARERKVLLDERVNNTKWCVLRFPNHAMAQLAETSQEAFEDFFFRVCNLDYARLSAAMDPLKALLEHTSRVRIAGPGTDLRFSVDGIPVVKCDGDRNIPDGEVYTAPVRDSVEGTIAFNAPSINQTDRLLYTNVRLEFREGRIVAADCDAPGAEKLNAVLDTDEGARYIGEFAIGVNPFIDRPIRDTLFDEKIRGSIHLTPGNAYQEAFNGNRSAIHWDLVLIQTPEFGGGDVYFDDVLVRRDGEFVVRELAGLNPSAFEA